jgi:hypothetical protein
MLTWGNLIGVLIGNETLRHDHDDRIVDDEADRQDERHHRQVVEAVTEP